MTLLILFGIFAALLPVALLFFYIRQQDAARPEPPMWLWKGFFYGVLSTILAVMVALLIPSPAAFEGTVIGAVYTAFCEAAIPEEGAKLFMLWLLLRKNPFFDEHLDGIVYAACIGLGFAAFENLLYVFGNLDNLVSIAIIRGIFSIPGHFFFAVAMGYFYSFATFLSATPAIRRRNFILAYTVPVILHGIYDGLLMSISALPVLAIIALPLFFAFCHKAQKKGRERIQLLRELDKRQEAVRSNY